MGNNCKICGKEEELRFWVCRHCADAESIIDSWCDMRDKWDAKTAMEKLKLLLSKWRTHKEINTVV